MIIQSLSNEITDNICSSTSFALKLISHLHNFLWFVTSTYPFFLVLTYAQQDSVKIKMLEWLFISKNFQFQEILPTKKKIKLSYSIIWTPQNGGLSPERLIDECSAVMCSRGGSRARCEQAFQRAVFCWASPRQAAAEGEGSRAWQAVSESLRLQQNPIADLHISPSAYTVHVSDLHQCGTLRTTGSEK